MRLLFRALVFCCVGMTTPGAFEAIEDLLHVAYDGHTAHDAGHDAHEREHGCTGTFHVCSCCASPMFVASAIGLAIHDPIAVTIEQTPRVPDGARPAHTRPVYRPPAAA